MTEVIRTRRAALPRAKSIQWNPTPEELKQLTARMPNARRTAYDNLNVQTRVVSRSKASTYVVTDTPENHSDQTITRAEGDRIATMQDVDLAGIGHRPESGCPGSIAGKQNRAVRCARRIEIISRVRRQLPARVLGRVEHPDVGVTGFG